MNDATAWRLIASLFPSTAGLVALIVVLALGEARAQSTSLVTTTNESSSNRQKGQALVRCDREPDVEIDSSERRSTTGRSRQGTTLAKAAATSTEMAILRPSPSSHSATTARSMRASRAIPARRRGLDRAVVRPHTSIAGPTRRAAPPRLGRASAEAGV